MKKTGLFSHSASALTLSVALAMLLLMLIASLFLPKLNASNAAETTASSAAASTASGSGTVGSTSTVTSAPLSTTTTSSAPTTAVPATSDITTAPIVTVEPPVTEPPIVQPQPDPIENSVFLTHGSPLRAGTEVTFIFSCSGEDVRALQGSITYDETLLTYKGVSTLDNSWYFTVDPSDGKLVYVGLSTEAEGASGVNSLFKLTFTLKADAITGNAIPFHISDATALKASKELTFSGGPCTFLVDRPISTADTLTALSIGSGTLAPEFASDVTDYRVMVPYEVSALELSATPASAYATVEISSTALEVGNNTITITVTAESGAIKRYTLTVTRASDPNYVPSSDSKLGGILLSDGMLFPAFSPSITEYTVYLVNEGSITLTPAPAPLGSAESVTLDATEGATATITSLAEDGSTTLYTFKVRTVTIDQFEQPVTTDKPVNATPNTPAPKQDSSADNTPKPFTQTMLFFALLAVVAVSLFFVGFAVGHVLNRRKKPPVSEEARTATDDEAEPSEPDESAKK